MKKQVCILALLATSTAWAQTEFKADDIPAALKENAHSVIRRHETTFTVKSPGEATQRIRKVITVLDQEADDEAKIVVGYDKLSKITNLEGALYDQNGKLIKKLKKNDIDDYSTFTDYNLFDDQRIKAAAFPKQPTYPYTVEFVVETTERNLMFYPSWMPQEGEHESLEQASYTITMPAGLALRYKEVNLPTPGTTAATPDGGKVYTWKVANRPAVEREPLAPLEQELFPVVYAGPTAFDVQEYKGKISSWSDVGAFYYTLNNGRDQLPESVQQQIRELVKPETTTLGKVRKVYKFVQDNTRYVSIQLGIGGWQTIEADKVALSKYGDCKALTNYTKALLKAAGVTAYPALVRAGDNVPDMMADFPSFQFNHVILCVPIERDTLFLECTSGHDPAGYTGDFTGNRHVLLVLPEGSHLIKTPVYAPTDNQQHRQISVTLTEQGDAKAAVKTRYTGLQQDAYAQVLHSMNQDEQRSWLLKRIHIPAFELNAFAYTEQPGMIPAVTETLKLDVRKWATMSGTRLFLPLNLMSALSPAAPLTQPRQTAVQLGVNYDFDDSDTVEYILPKGFVPEFQVAPVTIESKFGHYTAQVTVSGDHITYVRHITMHGGRYPASAYSEWVDFRKKVAKTDRMQLVFTKSN